MRKQSHPVSKRENYETYETVLYQRDDFHCPHNPEVAGSSPAAATIKRLISYKISRFSFKKVPSHFPLMLI